MKNLSFLVTLLIGLSSCSNHEGFRISGNLEGVADSVLVEFVPVSHSEEEPLATAVVTNGKFVVEGNIEEPRAVRVRLSDGYGSFPMFIENSNIEISGKAVSTGKTQADGLNLYRFENINVEGSDLTKRYREIYAVRDSLDAVYNKNQNDYKDVLDALFSTKSPEKTDSIKRTARYIEFINLDSIFISSVDKCFKKAILDNKDNMFGPLTMITLYSFFIPDHRDLYGQFSEDAQNSYYGQQVKKELYPAGAPGDQLPDFTISNDEMTTTLCEVCKSNKCVILDFWASWCMPCRKEIPNLKAIYDNYSDKGLAIVSISIDSEDEPWKKALKEENLVWTNCRDIDHSIANLFNIVAVPTIYVLDNEGKLIAENLRGEALQEKISEIINQES